MTSVSIIPCDDYNEEKVYEAVHRSLQHIGGMQKYVRPGQRVLLKVNALTPKPPEAAVTTHPAVIKAVVKLVREAGGVPWVGDSSGGMVAGQAPTRQTFEVSGIAKAAQEAGAELLNFDVTGVIPVSIQGTVKVLHLAKPAVEADVIITLPKLKTHSAAIYTGAVKNMYGCIPGQKKADYHRLFPKLKDFSRLLVDLYQAVRPSLAIMDAVIGMEGNGPSAGNPKKIGLIIAGPDGVAVDAIASSIIGLNPMRVHTTAIAHQEGIGQGDLKAIAVLGEKLESAKINDFDIPANILLETMPGFLIRGALGMIKAVPEINQNICVGCRFCVESCPVDAIKMSGEIPEINYSQCISCLCCQELCPRKAVEMKQTNPLGKVIAAVVGHRKRIKRAKYDQ